MSAIDHAGTIAAAANQVRAKLRERPLLPISGGFREAHGGLESVTAGLALPQMAHAALVDQFGPLRHEKRIAALRAGDLRT
jgi:hypothetical protein